ncbi:Excreted virulence factor EspC, type VII ESX diderm [Actinoplanes derwentensis]|uniref:Excreted virulence factor EspC, type VII ESX diderm n=1 Tax=Actinoplanes derwentensis TaxID=113562 RepID=A0A1H2C9Y5_9ACTN|nr:type VII secretion target [Actinoplanes derwentensis]SDT66876.1 Excreted virulence factor EspC, type VII ESX diderm [Actinoplanes derwentensis]
MQPGQLGVDVVALRVMGSDVAGAAVTLREAVAATGAGLVPAAPPGSVAGLAAVAAEKAWSAEWERLTVRADRLGRKMVAAADSYQSADRAGADELRRSGLSVF